MRAQAKLEAPLITLVNARRFFGGGVAISTLADVTFFGRDQTGHEMNVTGTISVNFADWADPTKLTWTLNWTARAAGGRDAILERSMRTTTRRRAWMGLGLVAVMTATGCTVKETNAPAVTGPSELGLSVKVTATPDVLTMDGQSQSLDRRRGAQRPEPGGARTWASAPRWSSGARSVTTWDACRRRPA